MAVINFANREIRCKIVYIGAAGAGCNTNVRNLHGRLEGAGTLHRFAAPDNAEATWFFTVDSEEPLAGFSVQYRIYSLPGGITDAAHRAEVLKEVDGVVFVADGRSRGLPDNEAALLRLEEALAAQDLELAALPVVLQVNHTDDDNSADLTQVVRPLNAYGFPVVRGAAKQGLGVVESFEAAQLATRTGLLDTFDGSRRSVVVRAHRDEAEGPGLSAQMKAFRGTPGTPTIRAERTDYSEPDEEVELPFQPRAFAGCHPTRILDANVEEGQVVVDIELERMGGGAARGLRVRLANRPTDQPLGSPRPNSPIMVPASPILGVTDHLPDKIEFTPSSVELQDEMPALWYGIAGVLGGLAVGVLAGFLIFH